MPCSATSRAQAATAPGTVTAWGEVGVISTALSRYHASVAAAGLRPEPFSAIGTAVPFGA